MNKLLKLLGLAREVVDTISVTLSPIDISNQMFQRSCDRARNKPSVFIHRGQHILACFISREINRIRRFTPKRERKALDLNKGQMALMYLSQGYLTFSDFGISPQAQYDLVELGLVTKELYKQLKAIPANFEKLLWDAEDRKEEYRRMIYDKLMEKHLWKPFFQTAIP